MVKALFLVFFTIFTLFSQDDVTPLDDGDPLLSKVQSFLNADLYEQNSKFIDIVFSPRGNFYKYDKSLDVVKIISVLKENGLLKLHFRDPQELKLEFKTSGSALFFVKLLSDALRNMGYYRYVTISSNFDGNEFAWDISLTSEYALDPMNLQKELLKSGCKVLDIKRENATSWSYKIDMSGGFLNVPVLEDGQELRLHRSLDAHWLDVSKVSSIAITSSVRNRWYPYIAYYDASLNLIKVIRRDKRLRRARLKIPSSVKYIKIADVYTLKNLKDDLVLLPKGREDKKKLNDF